MTNMIPPGEQVLKTDTKGRVRTPRQRREELLEEFELSGLSGKKFAALVGVKYQTFATWAHKRRQRGVMPTHPVAKPDAVRWLEAVVDRPQSQNLGPALVIELPGGAKMEVSDGGQAVLAARLLRHLEKAQATPC